MAPAAPSAGRFPRAAAELARWSRQRRPQPRAAPTCPEAASASLPAPRALTQQEPAGLCPSLGNFSKHQLGAVGGGEGRTSRGPCRLWVPSAFPLCLCGAGGGWDRTHDPVRHPAVPAGGFGGGGGHGTSIPGASWLRRVLGWLGGEGGRKAVPGEARVRTSSSAWASACSRPGCQRGRNCSALKSWEQEDESISTLDQTRGSV